MTNICKILTVEPVLLFYVTSSMMATLTTENLNLQKACAVNIGFSETVCEALALRNRSVYTPNQEIEVQKLVSGMLAYKTSIQGIIPILLLLFLGSWGDRHKKRNYFIFLPILGDTISTLGYILCTYFFLELPVEVAIIFEAVPVALTGTWFCFYVGVYSHISENSSEDTRTMRMGIVTIFTHMSLTTGMSLSGVAYRLLGFYGVFSLSILMFMIAALYGMKVVRDIPSPETEKTTVKKFFTEVFDFQHVKSTLSICTEKKPGNRRLKVVLIMLLDILIHTAFRGETTVLYMFTRRKFGWSEVDFSGYNTYNSITHMLGTLLTITVFVKWLQFDDSTLGMIGMFTKVFSCFANAFAATTARFYVAALFEIFNGISHMAMRSMISKLVPTHEVGKTFSLFALCEALALFLGGPLYSLIYRQTVDRFPGAFYFVSACLQCILFFIFLYLYLLRKNSSLEEDREIQDENLKMLNSDTTD